MPRSRASRCGLSRLSLLFGCLALALAPLAGAVERLDYRVTYRGVFSLGSDMPIADLSLASHIGDPSGLDLSQLEVTSGAYPFVESVYPIRYRFRTWTEPSDHRVLGFESSERMRAPRHRLYLRSASRGDVKRYDLLNGEGRAQLAQLMADQRPSETGSASIALFDRLGLLRHVRAAPLNAGAEFRLPVTSGRARLDYLVRVEGIESVHIGGQLLPAWKVRFEGTERGSDGQREMAHRPLFAWLAQDAARTPLRVDARHPVGRFRIELVAVGPGSSATSGAAAPNQSSVKLR